MTRHASFVPHRVPPKPREKGAAHTAVHHNRRHKKIEGEYGVVGQGANFSDIAIDSAPGDATPYPGVVLDGNGLTAYNSGGVATATISAADGSLTVSGGVITGGTIRTGSLPPYAIMDVSGIRAYNTGGVQTFNLNAADGSLTVTGASTITGGTIQTSSGNPRVVMDSSGIRAYSGAGVQTLTVSALDGSITVNGSATITGAIIQTSASNPRAVMDTGGIRLYNSVGTNTANLASDGSFSLTASLASITAAATGVTISSAASTATGARVVVNALGITGYNATNQQQFLLDSTSGLITATGIITASPGSTVPWQTTGFFIGGGNLLSNASAEDPTTTTQLLYTSTGLGVTAGTFTLQYGSGTITSALNWNSTAAQVQTALQAAGVLPTGATVTCSGGPFPDTPISVTLGGLGLTPSVIVVVSNSLTGGSAIVGPVPVLSFVNGVPSIWWAYGAPSGPNQVPNPSFESDTVGAAPSTWDAGADFWWNAGATLTVVSTTAQSGSKSCQVVTTAASTNQGLNIAQLTPPPGGWVAGNTYVFAVYLKGNAGGETVRLVLGHTAGGGTDFSTGSSVTLTTNWTRYLVTWTPLSSTPNNVGIRIMTATAQASTFFVDAAQVSLGSSAVPYYEGNGAVADYISYSSAFHGGNVFRLTATEAIGPTISQTVGPYGLVPGTSYVLSGYFSAPVAARSAQLTFTWLDPSGSIVAASTSTSPWTTTGNWQRFTSIQAVPPASTRQQIAISGSPTAGTFTLTYVGRTTTALNYNATAAQVLAALQALSNVGSTGVAYVSGGPLPGTPIVVSFVSPPAATPATLTFSNSLTGGTSPTPVITNVRAISLRTSVGFSAAASGEVLYVDAVQLEVGDAPTAFAPKPNEIVANTIQANMINVAQLSAISANLGNITAGTVTGVMIQTAAPTAARVTLDGGANAVRVYNATAEIVRLDPVNGLQLTSGTGAPNKISWHSGSVAGSTVAEVYGFPNATVGNVVEMVAYRVGGGGSTYLYGMTDNTTDASNQILMGVTSANGATQPQVTLLRYSSTDSTYYTASDFMFGFVDTGGNIGGDARSWKMRAGYTGYISAPAGWSIPTIISGGLTHNWFFLAIAITPNTGGQLTNWFGYDENSAGQLGLQVNLNFASSVAFYWIQGGN